MSDETAKAADVTTAKKKLAVFVAKQKKTTAGKNPRNSAVNTPFRTMVLEAVTKLNEKAGSSLIAIKEFIARFYQVDVKKKAPFIRKALKNLVETGKLTKPTGTGASGSFKLAVKTNPKAAKKTVSKPKANKAASPKKEIAGKKTNAAVPSNANPLATKKAKPHASRKTSKKAKARKAKAAAAATKAAKKAAVKMLLDG